MEVFTLNKGETHIALFQLLKANSMCSTGGEAKIMISEGLVKVNDEVTTVKRLKINPEHIVEYNGVQVRVVLDETENEVTEEK